MTEKQDTDIIQALNPADYFTLAMDDEIRREQMPGGLCGFGLELDQAPDIGALEARIREFSERFPLAEARLQQHGRRFFWCRGARPEAVFFQHRCPDDKADESFQHAIVDQLMNRQEPRETTAPLEFHLILGRRRHWFLLRWLHPFCDARGIELILNYLCTDEKTRRDRFDTPGTRSLVDAQLGKFRWWQKIRMIYRAHRYIHRLDDYPSILHGQFNRAPERLAFTTQRFSEEQTGIIAREARKQVGMTGVSLYYIGCMMRALYALEPVQPGEAYCVPYAFNLRKQKALGPVFGNHIGTLFAQAPKQLLDDREQLFSHLKQQNAQALRQQLDYAFLPLMWAAGWLSLKKYGHELRRSYKNGGERSSFWFSDTGQLNFDQNCFCNADITGLFHLTQVSSPPGLALLCCHYRGQLTLSYSYNRPLFSDAWISRLQQVMTRELLAQL